MEIKEIIKKHRQLSELALQDPAYCRYLKAYEDLAPAFRTYVNDLPDETRNLIWNYVDSGMLMHQSLIHLACQHMDFIDSEQKK